MNSSQVTI